MLSRLLFVGWSHSCDHSFPFHHHHHPPFTTANVPQRWRWCQPLSTALIDTPLNATDKASRGANEAECPCHVRGWALGKVSGYPSSSPPTSLTSFGAPGPQCKHDSERAERPCHVRGWALGKVSGHPSSSPPTSLTSFGAPGRQCEHDSERAERPRQDDGRIANEPSAGIGAGEW